MEKPNIIIEDIEFMPLTDDVKVILTNYRINKLIDRFIYRLIVSGILAIVITIFEYIAQLNISNKYREEWSFRLIDSKLVTNESLFILGAFIIFNLLSITYAVIKNRMMEYSDDMTYIYGTVTDKISSRALSKKTREYIPNYVLFDYDEYHCTTSLPTKDLYIFNRTQIDSRILVIKHSVYGVNNYDFYLVKNI